jgi:hypothetical protein
MANPGKFPASSVTGTSQKSEVRGLRSFASCCGTPLFFQDNEESEWIDVTIGSLDHPEVYSPEVTIWTEDRLPWVSLDPSRSTYRKGRPSAG